MSDASQRTLAWREQMRQKGYQPLTIWLPSSVKHDMEDLAYQRHQDLSALLVEAFQAWVPVATVDEPAGTRILKKVVAEEVARALSGARRGPAAVWHPALDHSRAAANPRQ